MAIKQVSGHVDFLRVHELGSRFGKPDDSLDAEVITSLDAGPDLYFGFQLRDDENRPVREAMLALLQDALRHQLPTTIDYDLDEGKKNGRLVRIWLTRAPNRGAA